MAKIQKYLQVGLELVTITPKEIIVRKIEAFNRRNIKIQIPDGFPDLQAGQAFIAEKLRGKIFFYYY